MLKVKLLVDDWREAWRWASVWVAALAVAFASLSPDMQASLLGLLHVPAGRVPGIIGLAMIVARLVNQSTAAQSAPSPTTTKGEQ